MSLKRTLLSLILYYIFSVVITPAVSAATTPTFPACSNPQGTIKARHDSGTHGIVGNTNEFKGSDTVYQLSPETVTQCFCPENGEGIQTNWWKAATLTQDEIAFYTTSGWIYVPNGSLWGLDNTPYIAQNSSYSCKNNTSGQVQGASSSVTDRVLGLAKSGNLRIMYGFLGLGLITLLSGLLLANYSKPTSIKSSKKRTYGRR